MRPINPSAALPCARLTICVFWHEYRAMLLHAAVQRSSHVVPQIFTRLGVTHRIPSKFDLRRFCRAVGASALVSLGAPRADELGFAGLLEVREVGGANVTVLSQVSGFASRGTRAVLVTRADGATPGLQGVAASKAAGSSSRHAYRPR